MKCEHVRQALQEHLERLLLPIDRAAVSEHLLRCEACSREASAMRGVLDSLAALPDLPGGEDVPASFASDVMRDLPEMLPAEEGAGHLVRWGLAAAAALFAFVLGLGLLIGGTGPEVAHEALDPLAASLRLGGLLLAHGASMMAAFLDASSTALASTGLLPKLIFALAFVLTNAALMGALWHYRPERVGATAWERGSEE